MFEKEESMETKWVIDYDALAPANEGEKRFFDLFKSIPQVIYDWGEDIVWIIDGDSEEDEKIPEKCHGIFVDTLIERAQVTAITSADIVVVLLCNQKKVEIRNAGTTELTDEWVEKIRANVEAMSGSKSPEIIVKR